MTQKGTQESANAGAGQRRPAGAPSGKRPAGAAPAGKRPVSAAAGGAQTGKRPVSAAAGGAQAGRRPAGAAPAGKRPVSAAAGGAQAGRRPTGAPGRGPAAGAAAMTAGRGPVSAAAQRPSPLNSAKKGMAGNRTKMILFGVEMVVLLLLVVVGVYAYKMTQSKPTTDGQGAGDTSGSSGYKYTDKFDESQVQIADELQQSEAMKKYVNIALFGVDATTESLLYRGSRSDSIMIASINTETGDIRLVSVYRDTFLNTDDNNKYQKANHAYSIGEIADAELKGGPLPSIKMLNKNLDLNITDFVTVGYRGLSEVIDGLGGVYIDVDSTELKHINNYQIAISEALKCSYTPVTETGYQLLNGIQAAAYCRIRYGGGDDFLRASRQREVIKAIEAQAKKSNLDTLTKVFNTASSHIFTNLDSKDILKMIGNIANYRIVEEDGFPQENMRTVANIGAKGSCVIPVSLEQNVVWLHQFLFEEQDYQVTPTVQEYSKHIKDETSKYINRAE